MATPQRLWFYTTRKDDVIGKEFHPHAEKLLRKYSQTFAASLRLQSQLIAHKNKADIVLSNHVEEALNKINASKGKFWSRELIIIIGSALFGAFIQGFVNELSTGNIILVATYTVLGFAGMFLVLWAIRD